ncbi:valyl-tRNA synthetase [Petrotoga sp. HWH.PT.55.6.1]|jgi:valyl-tRNA synthetase|uniref:valine--tRNA ligase n=1 Tax=unclassified Petrotoga TaxID=2620614 RepID=UPI000CA05D94|nr:MULTISPECIES: valine--tRNA ligase [unclassified Petrotoga]PNR90105.1 valyl-tRNA synthase [Petrotoga sp. 9T1HF07.CasAA.8.2]PNR94358.1 valyl-tRNA synthase [Petrotoga sp. HWHPT.55.6.3]RPD35320.1 valyl-tRNA synthetase [Petrotoga sp. HWH.PT.55.6.1]
MDIGKRYMPHELENKWYKLWEENHSFEPKPGNGKFSIVIPPPNITGRIHIGHALNIVLQDISVRYNRMKGKETVWIPGEDHAGIATQHVVEKYLLKEEGKRREDYTREEFLKITWDWANKYRNHIREQIKALAASVDWSRERFTLDEGLNQAVRKVFVSLYNDGLIYKGKYIVNWCPSCGTVLADDEVEHSEEKGKLWYIKYPLENTQNYVTVATTRPETMLGDTALAVNPSDERYKDLIGETAILPIVGRKLKIIADPYVDTNFGTGVVKVTPAHDPNDYQIGLRHDLERIQIIDENAKINENGGKYAGLDRYIARERIVEDLKKEGLLEKEEDYTHSVGHCYRCDTVIEPLLLDQWFVKMKPLAEKAIQVVENDEIKFYPERWKKVYLNWMYEIRDWCISRQLWWGHRIPVWYCQNCGHVNVSVEDVKKCEKCGSTDLKQDEDVLDTWFSSALWPFSTLGWPEETEDLKRFYPTDLLVTGFDIIFFWVARMIMMGEKFMGEKPFHDVYLHQLVRDKYGRKMSKSLGNGVDPLEVINEYGTDPVRFTLAVLAAQGRDIKLDVGSFDAYRKFANKIWNATRFVLLNMEDHEKIELKEEDLKIEDKWILSRLNSTILEISKDLEGYNYDQAARKLYDFFWNELCDWYIEASKNRLNSSGNDKLIVQNVILQVFDSSLRLLHPFMPYISEELWQKLPIEKDSELLISAKWPEYNENNIYPEAEKVFSKVMELVSGIRNVKAEMDIPQTQEVEVKYKIVAKNDDFIEENIKLIEHLAFLKGITQTEVKPAKSATAYVDESVEVYIPLGEYIDVDTEKQRLTKKLEKLSKDIELYNKKLSNKNFVEKADPDVVEKTKEDLKESEKKYQKLQALLKELS